MRSVFWEMAEKALSPELAAAFRDVAAMDDAAAAAAGRLAVPTDTAFGHWLMDADAAEAEAREGLERLIAGCADDSELLEIARAAAAENLQGSLDWRCLPGLCVEEVHVVERIIGLAREIMARLDSVG